MRSGGQLIGSFAVLLLLQAATALVAIALLGRMSPAFERILLENVASAEAVEAMTLVLARTSVDDAARANYRKALERASKNVTEPEEQPLISQLSALAESALAGDPEARGRSLEALERLGDINRRAMASARDEAERLGMAGAWAVTFLGVLALGVSFISAIRTRRRILAPLSEIARVVTAHQLGDRRQRCTRVAGDGDDIAVLGTALNEVLDQSERAQTRHDTDGLERAILLHVLDERSEPVAVVDESGELLAANRAAEALLAGPRGPELRASLRVAREAAAGGRIRATPIGSTGALLCVFEPGS